jgi:RNA processing factor Prp31
MSDDVDTGVRRVVTTLTESRKLTFPDLSALLGTDRDYIARVLAWLLMRGIISTGREGNTLYVTLSEEGVEKLAHGTLP